MLRSMRKSVLDECLFHNYLFLLPLHLIADLKHWYPVQVPREKRKWDRAREASGVV